MKKFNLKSGVCGFMAGVVIATAVPVLAYNGSMDILATFKNIKIIIDGTELTPRDSAGNVLEPFIYNGSTYLPVRAVGEAVGKDVSYDSNNNYVYINSPTDTSSGNTQSQGTKLTAYNTLGNCMNVNLLPLNAKLSFNRSHSFIFFRNFSRIFKKMHSKAFRVGNWSTFARKVALRA